MAPDETRGSVSTVDGVDRHKERMHSTYTVSRVSPNQFS